MICGVEGYVPYPYPCPYPEDGPPPATPEALRLNETSNLLEPPYFLERSAVGEWVSYFYLRAESTCRQNLHGGRWVVGSPFFYISNRWQSRDIAHQLTGI